MRMAATTGAGSAAMRIIGNSAPSALKKKPAPVMMAVTRVLERNGA